VRGWTVRHKQEQRGPLLQQAQEWLSYRLWVLAVSVMAAAAVALGVQDELVTPVVWAGVEQPPYWAVEPSSRPCWGWGVQA
jgi:hypothetical protein